MNTKITHWDAFKILESHKQGVQAVAIAKQFDISPTTVKSICTRRIYHSVDVPVDFDNMKSFREKALPGETLGEVIKRLALSA